MDPVSLTVMIVGVVAAATASVISGVQQKKNAEAAYAYKSKVLQAQADQQKAAIEQEAQIMARKAKYQQGTQRATGAAMGLGMGGSSFEDVTQMNIGLATMDLENKRYEADLAQWEADMQKANATFERNVTVATANTSIAGGVIGAIGEGAESSSGAMAEWYQQKQEQKAVKQTLSTGGLSS